MNTVPLEQLSFEAFTQVVNTNFRVWVDTADFLQLQLCEISPPQVTAAGGTKGQAFENFALVFRGPADRVLPQRIYTFESAALGRFDLFIVPFSRDQNFTSYQATFNRLVK